MNFINPWLLLGTLGVALPILAHLLNKHQFKHTDWAAMQFLNKAVRVRSRQIRLRDIILLVMRCLALLFLIFAIARPSLQKGDTPPVIEGESRTAIVIALDASFSMQHSNGSSTRFERALQEIETLTKNFNPGDPISLVLLADKHKIAVRNMAYNEERFVEILRAQKPTSEQLNMETVPTELAKIADSMEAIQKEIYIISDLQTQDWKGLGQWMQNTLKELSDKAKTFILPIQGKEENLAVTKLELFSGSLRKGTIARYSATVQNYDTKPASNVKVRCIMEGVNVDTKTIPRINPQSSETVSFFIPFHNSGAVKIEAKLENDALNLDNVRRTVANIREKVSILCVEGKTYGNSLENFISKALQARARQSEKEDFKVRSVSWLSLPAQNLNNFDIVILSDVPEITKDQAAQLRDYVSSGKGLIWFGGENVKTSVWNERSKMKDESFLLPASIELTENVTDEAGIGLPIDPVLPDHPVCRPLHSLPKDLLSETKFDQLHNIKTHSTSRSILSLSGSKFPLLVEHSIGRGHVFMFTSSSNPYQNNLALTPVFPMIMQQMVTYLTGREFEKDQLVGASLALSYAEMPDVNNGVFESPSGDITEVPVRQHGNRYVALLDEANEAGFYMAKVSLQSPGSPIPVNINTVESNVRCLDPQEAQLQLDKTGIIVAKSMDDLIVQIQNSRTGYEYWRLLMIAGLVFLVLESILASNMFKRESAKAKSTSNAPLGMEGA